MFTSVYFCGCVLPDSYFATKTDYTVSLKILPLLVLAAAFSYFGNLFQIHSFQNAPNPGYVIGIGALNIVVVTVASYYLFGSEVTVQKLSGVALTMLGVVLIGL